MLTAGATSPAERLPKQRSIAVQTLNRRSGRDVTAAGLPGCAALRRRTEALCRSIGGRPVSAGRCPAYDSDQLSSSPGVIVENDPDQPLVERCRNGDREAFTELVVRYQTPIYNAAFWLLRKVEDANDIAQIVFLRVWERLDEYDSHYKFFSWIYRIAVNESLNLLRRKGREDPLDEDFDIPDDDSADPESKLAAAQQSRQIQRAMMKMTTDDRLVLTLRHFSECSYQEIAQILDLDEKTVKSRLFEARRRLRDMLNGLRPN
ncbi:MAG: RNA polymerase sigma factor [Gemmatimonadota bacterium]